jgi:hypothetical protein
MNKDLEYKEIFYGLVPNADDFVDEADTCLAYHAIKHGSTSLKVIISHSDLDGVTSAVNLAEAAKILGSDVIVYLERTSRQEKTSDILDSLMSQYKDVMSIYKDIEIMISDRMFIDLSRDHKIPRNMYFSWYDHHAGNVIGEEVIREKLGDRLRDYKIATDINHCGATITWEAMRDRIASQVSGLAASNYSEAVKIWSLNVNLWDTFQWKNKPGLSLEDKILGKKMGSIDKMMESEKHLFQKLMFKLSNYETLDHNMVYDWIDNLDKEYKDLVEEEYNVSSKRATRYNEKITILPAEWKFASNVKELWVNDHPETDIVITCHKSGGTVYTSVSYETPSYEIAKFIGESYGLNGGGHKNAAGFGCLDLAVSEYLSEDEMKYVVEDRIIKALDRFFENK